MVLFRVRNSFVMPYTGRERRYGRGLVVVLWLFLVAFVVLSCWQLWRLTEVYGG